MIPFGKRMLAGRPGRTNKPGKTASTRKRLKERLRFSFFQRQFLSHSLIAALVLGLLGASVSYFSTQAAYKNKNDELGSAGKSIVRLIQREDSPAALLLAYRAFAADRGISFVLFDRKGEMKYKDSFSGSQLLRSKTFLDNLRGTIPTAKNGKSFIEKETGDPLMVAPRTVKSKELGDDLYVFVIAPVKEIKQSAAMIKRAVWYTAIAALVLAIIISWLVSRNMSRGVRQLRQATQRIADGDLSARSVVERRDELGDLSGDFNRMAQQLDDASRKLELFEQRRGRFLTDIAHELRTPLTSIRGIVEGFRTNLIPDPEDQRKYLAIIEKETFRLIRLINELLDSENIENGTISLNVKPYDARELLEITAETLDVLIGEKRLSLDVSCEPGVRVYGDFDRLTQVMINLVKNSIQFSDFGTIRLSAEASDDGTLLTVSDSGKGMTEDELQSIFERFYKADPSRAKGLGESGLGLSIVKRLVAAHGGTIEALSEPGIGTTFRVWLPSREA